MMEQAAFDKMLSCLERAGPVLDALDEAIRGRRGPRGAPVRALAVGIVLAYLEHQTSTVKAAWRVLRERTSEAERAALGLPEGPLPSYVALLRTFERLRRAVGDGLPREAAPLLAKLAEAEDRAGRCAALMDLLVGPSVPEASGAVLAADTTYLDACCRPVARERFDAGERASDPDAAGRRIERPNGEERRYFGYAVSTVVSTGPGPELIEALRVQPANADDRPAVLDMVSSLARRGRAVRRLVVDRGIKSEHFNASLRALGTEPVFDLDANEGGFEGTYQGLLVVDGWLYSPALPERLRNLGPKPLPTGPEGKARLEQWLADMAERQRYAWRVRQTLGPGRVQLHPPAGVGCKHPKLRRTMRAADPALAACPGGHGPEEACAMATVVWSATRAPVTWQTPARGSKDWQDLYARRSAVERANSLLKNPDLVQLKNKAIRVRGLEKFSFMVALAVVATNLHLLSLHAARGTPSSRAA